MADTVASLEKRVSLLEPGKIDSLRQKAQLARAELDGLAKSRATAAVAAGVGGAGGASGLGASSTSGAARQKKVCAFKRHSCCCVF